MSEKYSVSRQRQISGIIIAFVVCVLCLLVVVSKKAFASNSYTQAVKLAGLMIIQSRVLNGKSQNIMKHLRR